MTYSTSFNLFNLVDSRALLSLEILMNQVVALDWIRDQWLHAFGGFG